MMPSVKLREVARQGLDHVQDPGVTLSLAIHIDRFGRDQLGPLEASLGVLGNLALQLVPEVGVALSHLVGQLLAYVLGNVAAVLALDYDAQLGSLWRETRKVAARKADAEGILGSAEFVAKAVKLSNDVADVVGVIF